jgi:hypothetical protein
MNALVGAIAGCTFAIPPPPADDGTLSRADIAVIADEDYLSQDATNGWSYAGVDFNAMQLHGTACDAVRSGAIKTLSVVFRCKGVSAP